MKQHRLFSWFACITVLTAVGFGQAIPASRRLATVQVGGGLSIATPDFGQSRIKGFTVFADLDLPRHFGIEAELHQITLSTPTAIGEASYLIGPRFYYSKPKYHLSPYAKVLVGLGRFEYMKTTPYFTQHTENHLASAFGVGLDIPVTKRIIIRPIDYEYQIWPGYANNGLTPHVYTFGAAYHF